MGIRDFRRSIRELSGISLYREGFRILPYGEPDNDWLRLDRRRVNNPPLRLSNNQILGVIQLTADGNPELQDQTNREGLVTNDAYEHLAVVVTDILAYLESRRFTARREMDVDGQRRSSSLPALNGVNADADLDQLLEKVSGNASTESIGELKATLKTWRESSADVVRHYAGLASVGQMSGLVFGQIRHPLRQIRSETALAL